MSEYSPKRGYGGVEDPRRAEGELRDDVEGAAERSVAGPRREADDYEPARSADDPNNPSVEDSGSTARRAIVEGGDDAPYKIDVNGRGHRPSDSDRAGAFLSKYEEDQINSSRDQINDGAGVQSAAQEAYQSALADGKSEAEANEAAQAVYDTHEKVATDSQAVEELADAIENGDVSDQEAARKIAELTSERDKLSAKVEALESEVAQLNAKLSEVLEKLNQMTVGNESDEDEPLSDEEIADLADGIQKKLDEGSEEGPDQVLTAEQQAELNRRLAEEDATSRERENKLTPEQIAEMKLTETRNRYAELTAGDRLNVLGRFLKADTLVSKVVRKIPGTEWLIDKINNTSHAQNVEQARAEYENAVRELEKLAVNSADTEGMTIEEIQRARVRAQVQEELALTQQIHDIQMKSGRERNKFTDWWVRHNGIGGKIMKAGVVVGASLLTGGIAGGIAAGVFGAAAAAGIAGSVVGAGTGASIAKHVSDRRARSFTEKGGNVTVAAHEMDRDRSQLFQDLDNGSEPDRGIQGEAVATAEVREPRRAIGPDWVRRATGVIEARTDEIVKNNRRRMKTAIGLGAAAGGLAGNLVGNWVDSWTGADPGPPQDEPKVPDQPKDPEPTPDLKGQEFFVEPGHGPIHEVEEALQANGINVPRARAEEIYNQLFKEFGDKMTQAGPEYHGPSGDLRFGNSEMYEWGKGVLERMVELAK